MHTLQTRTTTEHEHKFDIYFYTHQKHRTHATATAPRTPYGFTAIFTAVLLRIFSSALA